MIHPPCAVCQAAELAYVDRRVAGSRSQLIAGSTLEEQRERARPCSQRSDSKPWVYHRRHLFRRPDPASQVGKPRNEECGSSSRGRPGPGPRVDLRRRPDRLHPPGVAGGPVRVDREPARDAGPAASAPPFQRVGTRPPALRRRAVRRPLSWLAGELANPATVLARAGVAADEVTEADKAGLAAAAPEIVAAVKRMLDGVRDGELAPAPAEPVAAARTGWL